MSLKQLGVDSSIVNHDGCAKPSTKCWGRDRVVRFNIGNEQGIWFSRWNDWT